MIARYAFPIEPFQVVRKDFVPKFAAGGSHDACQTEPFRAAHMDFVLKFAAVQLVHYACQTELFRAAHMDFVPDFAAVQLVHYACQTELFRAAHMDFVPDFAAGVGHCAYQTEPFQAAHRDFDPEFVADREENCAFRAVVSFLARMRFVLVSDLVLAVHCACLTGPSQAEHRSLAQASD